MTVCVAAMCERDLIIGASDRMVTSGDVQFEPSITKIWAITDSITVMTAGDSSIQTVILRKVMEEIYRQQKKLTGAIIPVLEAAEIYASYYCEEKSAQAARKYLSPFRLDQESFLVRQNEFSPDFVRQLGNNIMNFTIPDVEAIISGIDNTGAHIYQIINDEVICQDVIGFAAIGAGGWHANSQFMFAGHTGQKGFSETLYLTYTAKKRAEVAPGVGTDTDMFTIGPEPGSYLQIGTHITNKLEAVYNDLRTRERAIRNISISEVEKYVEEITRPQESARAEAEQENALTEGSGGHQPDDQEEVRDGVEEGEPENRRTVH